MDPHNQLERLCEEVARCLARFDSQVCGRAVVAAVSGGADSLALLLALRELAQRERLPGRLWVAHVDHATRAADHEGAARVRETCEHLGLLCVLKELDAGLPADEATLREARYAALQEVARGVGAGCVLTAHHADDDLETLLLRLMRGTGPRGLAGVPEMRRLAPDLLVLRPFLRLERSRLQAVVTAAGLVAHEDPANADPRYARTAVRHELLPLLKSKLPGFEASLRALQRTAQAVTELVDAQALRILTECCRAPVPWLVELDTRRLLGADVEFVRAALRELLRRLHPGSQAPDHAWVERCVALLTAATGARAQGKGRSLLVERTRDGLLCVDLSRAGAPPVEPAPLPIGGGEVAFGTTEWRVQAIPQASPPLDPAPGADPSRTLLARSAPEPWFLRARRPGDRFRPLGLEQDVELARFLQARHVPRFHRDRRPLLVDRDGAILAIPGVEIGAIVQVGLGTGACVEVWCAQGGRS
jgi:tRNA(Ile)-lysidine synthase